VCCSLCVAVCVAVFDAVRYVTLRTNFWLQVLVFSVFSVIEHCVAVYSSVLQCTGSQFDAVCCSVLQCVAAYCL